MPIRPLLILALLSQTAFAADDVARTERMTVLMLGKPAGQQIAEYGADGNLRVHYEYNDRGRGPKIDAEYTVDADGTLRRMALKGVNYLKSPVAEEYERKDDGEVRWKNASEDETRADGRGKLYFSLDGAPEEYALFLRAALATKDRRLSLLPDGEARVEPLTTASFEGKGGKVEATMYAIHGLDLKPNYLWLDVDQRFFASWSSWQSTIREGYEGAIDDLGAKQKAFVDADTLTRSKALTHTLKKPLVIENVRVFDPQTLRVEPGQSVVIEDGRIVAVGPAAEIESPKDAERWDGQNRFLMPGLWDMHVHVGGDTDGLLRIASGVTTVRDLANDNDELAKLMAAYESGTKIGPRVLRAGFVDGRGPYAGPTKVFVDTEAEARAAVKMFADAGFVQLKVYSSIKPELIPLLIQLAHERGMRVSGHVPQGMSAREFVLAGADEVQHANFVLLNFLADDSVDTRTPQRFKAVAERGAEVDLAGQPMRDLIGLFVEHKTVIDPTLVAFEDMFLDRPGRMGPTWVEHVERFPATWQRMFRAAASGLETTSSAEETRNRRSYQRMVDLVGLLFRSGVTIVAGTDAFPAFMLVRELELYVSAGIPPAETLRIATLGAAQVMNREKDYGRVAPGYVADLILIDGDPTLRIADLLKVHTVLRGDRWFESSKLFEAVSIKRN